MKCCNDNQRILLVVSWAYQATCVYCNIITMGQGCFLRLHSYVLDPIFICFYVMGVLYFVLLNIPHSPTVHNLKSKSVKHIF